MIRLKTTKKMWINHFTHYNSMGLCSRVDNSILFGPIWSKFELLLDIMNVLNTYKFKMVQINSNRKKVATSIFLEGQGSLLCGPWLDLADFQTHPSSYVCHHYLQVWKGSDLEQLRKSCNTVFYILSLWGFFPEAQERS